MGTPPCFSAILTRNNNFLGFLFASVDDKTLPNRVCHYRKEFAPRHRAADKQGVLRIIQRYFFLFLNKNRCCHPSLECLNKTVLMNGQKIRLQGEIWLIIPKLSLLPLLIWSTVAKFFPLVVDPRETNIK